MACREKYKPCILKYKALILKYVPYIFDVCKTLFLRCLEKAIFRGIFGRIFGVRQMKNEVSARICRKRTAACLRWILLCGMSG